MNNIEQNFYQFLQTCVEDISTEKLNGKLTLQQIEEITHYICTGNKRTQQQCKKIEDTIVKLINNYFSNHNIELVKEQIDNNE